MKVFNFSIQIKQPIGFLSSFKLNNNLDFKNFNEKQGILKNLHCVRKLRLKTIFLVFFCYNFVNIKYEYQ
ncbi:hypothetical protein DKG77_08395 [Flagellimonas aquimarina]|uniref:Uncharacterized protein n=1 Tax=Flagellimonas aquimarina TaxID=2201895 RepID=A0A316KYZ5_9FLAO|nr:hypothetical protein DKG77_08395 [Allomuricauda koreensis]